FLSILLVAPVLPSSLAGQQGSAPPLPVPQIKPQKPDDTDVVKITTNLVQVDAVVFDKNGKAVTDLTADEVKVFEDDKPQKITHFVYNMSGAEPSNPLANPAVPGKPNEVAPPVVPETPKPGNIYRTIAIVVDDLGLSFES